MNLITAFGSSSTKYALGEKSTVVLLKPPLILDSSIAQLFVVSGVEITG